MCQDLRHLGERERERESYFSLRDRPGKEQERKGLDTFGFL
jgi:hypothetical protein